MRVVAGISMALSAAAVAVPQFLAAAPYPSPYASDSVLWSYVESHPTALRFAAAFTFAAAIPLGVFTAAVTARLHGLGVRAAGPTIALVGGVLAVGALAVSSCALWVLSRMDGGEPSLVRALHDFAFISGGAWHVVALGLLLAGVAVSAAFSSLLPRPVWVAGVLLAVVCELATLVFVSPAATVLLPIGRFGGLTWLVVAGVALPRSRSRRVPAGDTPAGVAGVGTRESRS